tara:strand:+ start:170 stop:751 length:582 start_codon:yes stop_codon:yes gene_type:complete
LNEKNTSQFFEKVNNENIKVSLEIGFGSGENLLNLISKNEERFYFIGCEPYLNGMASFLGNLKEKDYFKVRVFKNDVRELISICPKEILSEIFILFPDPWPKSRHEKRRIINYENITLLLSCLKPNGKIYIATDVKNYFDSIKYLFKRLKNVKILNKSSLSFKPINIISTRYEKKALADKKKPFYIEVKKILD